MEKMGLLLLLLEVLRQWMSDPLIGTVLSVMVGAYSLT